MLKQINGNQINVSKSLIDKMADFKLSKSTYKTILYLVNDISKYDNGINKTQKDIAKELNLSLGTISKIFKILNQLDIVRRRYKNFWVFNPNYAYKCSPRVFKSIVKDWDKIPLYSNSSNVIDFTSFKKSHKK